MWGLSCCGGAVASFIQDVPMTLGYLLLSLFSVQPPPRILMSPSPSTSVFSTSRGLSAF